MSELPLGKIIDGEQQRDAIHIAVAPVIAACSLSPGQHVGFVEGSIEQVEAIADGPRSPQNKPAIGIVDPFLTVRVMTGDRFWMFLYPQTITSLRHDWTHPAFVAAPVTTKSNTMHKSESALWLESHADMMDLTYSAMMRDAQTWLEEDEHTVQHGSESWRSDFGDPVEFWHHYEIVTGTVVPEERKRSFYCCSC